MGKFFALLYRMKYILRWSLMRNVNRENIAEHSYHVAVLAHSLAVIARDVFGKDINPERAAVCALYHDLPEILTGDLPTPIKYYNADIKKAYKSIERDCSERLLEGLCPEMRGGISEAVLEEDGEILRIVRAADKLDAYIKCKEELLCGNGEFKSAEAQTLKALSDMESPEVSYFMEHYIDAFSLTLDELEKR